MVNNELMRCDVAIEIISEMIADNLLALENEKDENVILELNKERKVYKKQRNEVYSRNKETIDYVIEIYGNKLKKKKEYRA